MNIKTKFDKALSEIKAVEGKYTEKCKSGSKDMTDYLEMSYFSGLLNGFKFVWYIFDHPNEITDQKFDLMLREILRQKEVN